MKDLNDPSNRDTIPAMLTAGEFVMNKEATAMFKPQIEKMNNAGLAQRQAENQVFGGHNMGGVIQQNGYNTGGLVTFLKDKEGWKDTAYQDDAGVWTIGYGRTGNVKKGDTTTKAIEDPWLDTRAAEELAAVKAFGKKHGYEWNDGQMNALASFRYNGGSGMLDQLTADGTRDNDTIQKKFGLYNKITNPDTGKKEFLQGLQNRRDFELELWNGTTPTETAQAAVPGQDLPVPEVATEVGGFPGGDDIVSAGVDQVVGQAFAPPQMMAPPQMPQPQAAPEFIPSVTQNNLPTSVPQMPTEESNPMNNNSLWNSGGPVYLNRGGIGKKKVWDSATQKYIFVDPSDIRVEQEKALAASAPVRNNQMKPMGFAQAAQPNITHMGPRQTRAPHQSPFVSPDNSLMQFDRSPDDIGDEIQRGWNKEDFDMGAQSQPGTVPQIGGAYQAGPQPPQMPGNMTPPPPAQQDLPPVPGSDEALLQGSSQQVELAEQQPQQTTPAIDQSTPRLTPNVDAMRKQYNPMNEGRRDYFDPRDPRNNYNPDAHTQAPPAMMAPPPQVTDLSGMSEEEIGILYDQGNPAAIAYAENEDQQFKAIQQTDLVRKKQAVANPTTDGAAVLAAQEAALQEQLAQLQTTPEGAQVGESGSVPALGTPEVKVHEQAGDAYAMPTVPEELGEISTGIDPGDINLSPNFGADPRGEGTSKQKFAADMETKKVVSDVVTNAVDGANVVGEPEAPVTDPKELETAGAQVGGRQKQEAMGAVREAFGDLFDKKELIRMAIVFAGAMATGASPGRALAISGQMYLGRLDAKHTGAQKLAAGGKYTPASIEAFKKSGDIGSLVPTGSPMEETGETKEFFGKGGKKIGRKVKVGDNTFWVDQNGKNIDPYEFSEDPSRVEGNPKYDARVKAVTGDLKDSLKGLHETFDKPEGQDFAKTDIIPAVQAGKIADWAIKNDVDPSKMAGLVESAYHDAINDKRADGSRVRDLTPYLEQLVIRQQLPGSADLFKSKADDGEGAPEYVSARKMQGLNSTAARVLQGMGLKGGVSDLSNRFYTEALADWNKPETDRDMWNSKALKDENGFYLFAQNMLVQGEL